MRQMFVHTSARVLSTLLCLLCGDRDARIDGLQQQVRQQQAQLDDLKKLLCLNHADAAVCKEGR